MGNGVVGAALGATTGLLGVAILADVASKAIGKNKSLKHPKPSKLKMVKKGKDIKWI